LRPDIEGEGNEDTSFLPAKSLPLCHENQITLPGNYFQHNVVCIGRQIFCHSFVYKDYICL
jgi:hypothetical protein